MALLLLECGGSTPLFLSVRSFCAFFLYRAALQCAPFCNVGLSWKGFQPAFWRGISSATPHCFCKSAQTYETAGDAAVFDEPVCAKSAQTIDSTRDRGSWSWRVFERSNEGRGEYTPSFCNCRFCGT